MNLGENILRVKKNPAFQDVSQFHWESYLVQETVEALDPYKNYNLWKKITQYIPDVRISSYK